jgi:hypothetical protein
MSLAEIIMPGNQERATPSLGGTTEGAPLTWL